MDGGPTDSHLYKVLVIGNYATGKTSLIRRYTEGQFSHSYKLTIGVDFAVKEISWSSTTSISLQLWDVAGHERFGTMTRVYYRYAIAAIIVFDVTRPATFEAVLKWRDDVNSKVVLPNGEQIPILLLANKCDLQDVDGEKLDQFVKANNMIGWFATSAQDNVNVDQAMKFLISKILEVSSRVQLDAHKLPSHNSAELSVVPGEAGKGAARSREQPKKESCEC